MLIVDSDLFLTFSEGGMLASTRPSFGMLRVLFCVFFPRKKKYMTNLAFFFYELYTMMCF